MKDSAGWRKEDYLIEILEMYRDAFMEVSYSFKGRIWIGPFFIKFGYDDTEWSQRNYVFVQATDIGLYGDIIWLGQHKKAGSTKARYGSTRAGSYKSNIGKPNLRIWREIEKLVLKEASIDRVKEWLSTVTNYRTTEKQYGI